MGLFDVIDDIAQHQVLKTETGDNRIYGVVVGTVTKNYDESMPGRVCVEMPTRDKEANELRWARLAFSSGGKLWGHYFLPEVGDQVLVAFEQGNIEKPYVIGCLYKDSDKTLAKNAEESNRYKSITTRHGSTIRFSDDKEDEEGHKDIIEVITAGEDHKFIMDNERRVIHLTDKDKKNQIKISTEEDNGNILITTDKKLTIKVGDNIELIMNASNGTVTIKSNKLKVEASEDIKLESNSKAEITGPNVKLDAGSILNLNSSNAVKIGGNPIKLG